MYLLLQSTIHLWNTTTPNKFHILANAYIPSTHVCLLQLTIDLWNTTTPHRFHILENTHRLRTDVPPPPPISHRSMEYHYTK